IAVLLNATGHRDEALRSANEALATAERLAQDRPRDAARLDDLASCHHLLAVLLRDAGQPEESLARYARAPTPWGQLGCANHRSDHYQGALALCINNSGVVQNHLGRHAEALQAFEAARGIREKLLAEGPKNAGRQIAVAASYRDLGVVHDNLRKP